MNNIGILTHHFASNFGANLQTLSTVGYLKSKGFNPFVINWRDDSLEKDFSKSVQESQNEEHRLFLDSYLPVTDICRTDKEIADVIKKNNIEAVVIGSDAVVQHHPLVERIAFPTHTIFSVRKFSNDRLFPNFFWGSFEDYLENKIPIAFMSVSCQNSPYSWFTKETIKSMRVACNRFNYISVRDSWTKRMFSHIDKKYENVDITPDPVFAFNQNAGKLILSEDAVRLKYGLAGKYVLLSFFGNSDVNMEWIKALANEIMFRGFQPIILPFPSGACHIEGVKEIELPLSPLDWYALIKYSSGYIGRNMHPIVVSLHNSVPFFCLDQYGTRTFNIFVNQKSSKIYDILERAEMLDNRITLAGIHKSLPDVKKIMDIIESFDRERCLAFSKRQLLAYNKMMESIIKSFD